MNTLLGIFLIIFIFAYLIFNSTLRQLALFSVMIFFISVIPNLNTEGEDIDLANINMNSVFTNSDYQSLKNTPSIVLLVYDGYPQLETLENMNIDNSEHINFYLIKNLQFTMGYIVMEATPLQQCLVYFKVKLILMARKMED